MSILNNEMIDKILIGLISAILALILKAFYDRISKTLELSKLKQVLVADLVHQISTAVFFHFELDKLLNIYMKGLKSIDDKIVYDFYKELQATQFKEVFFSDETFKTIKKTDLLMILQKNSKHFGEINNIYHIALKLKNCNTKYYEDLYDEHLLAYLKGVEETDMSARIEAFKKALNYITMKLQADMNNAITLSTITYDYLEKLIGERKLKREFGIELKNEAQQVV